MFLLLAYGPTVGIKLNTISLYIALFFIGILTSAHPLVFAIAKENFPLRSAGAVVATTNTLVMVGGFAFQPLFGHLLDVANGTVGVPGVHIYSAHDYQFAMMIMPVSLFAAWVAMFFIKDTGKEIEKQEQERTTEAEE